MAYGGDSTGQPGNGLDSGPGGMDGPNIRKHGAGNCRLNIADKAQYTQTRSISTPLERGVFLA